MTASLSGSVTHTLAHTNFERKEPDSEIVTPVTVQVKSSCNAAGLAPLWSWACKSRWVAGSAAESDSDSDSPATAGVTLPVAPGRRASVGELQVGCH